MDHKEEEYEPHDGDDQESLLPHDEESLLPRHRSFEPTRSHLSTPKLNVWLATAICGNDIMSSCFYTVGLVIDRAGGLAPFCLLLVAILLYFFRFIYEEIGSALRVNGGIYTVMVNTTNKYFAAFAGSLTVLSYCATAVVSANSAFQYLNDLVQVDEAATTIMILILFMILTLLGLQESAVTALFIMAVNLLSLTTFVICGLVYAFSDGWDTFDSNWDASPPSGYNRGAAFFFGFSTALLGISGFETAANYIEEQGTGVYRKVLRNIWVMNCFYNVSVAIVALAALYMYSLGLDSTFLLSAVGDQIWGGWFGAWMNVNGVLVLSASVLTSYVGVQGVVCRMAQDRVLPSYLQHKNELRKTRHWLIISFCLLCIVLFALCHGATISKLTSVYTIAFVTVMSLYAVGVLMLKARRPNLPRAPQTALWLPYVVLALTFTGLIGIITLEGDDLLEGLYPIGIIWATMLWCLFDMHICRGLSYMMDDCQCCCFPAWQRALDNYVRNTENKWVIYFAKDEDKETLREAFRYVLSNEQRRCIKVVHVTAFPEDVPQTLADAVRTIKNEDEFAELRIEFELVEGQFNSGLLESLEEQFLIPRNFMFVACPSHRAVWRYDQMHGVRIIVTHDKPLREME